MSEPLGVSHGRIAGGPTAPTGRNAFKAAGDIRLGERIAVGDVTGGKVGSGGDAVPNVGGEAGSDGGVRGLVGGGARWGKDIWRGGKSTSYVVGSVPSIVVGSVPSISEGVKGIIAGARGVGMEVALAVDAGVRG